MREAARDAALLIALVAVAVLVACCIAIAYWRWRREDARRFAVRDDVERVPTRSVLDVQDDPAGAEERAA